VIVLFVLQDYCSSLNMLLLVLRIRNMNITLSIMIYIYPFSRRFYPKRVSKEELNNLSKTKQNL